MSLDFFSRQWGAVEVHKAVERCWLQGLSLVSMGEMNWRDKTMEKCGLKIQAGDNGDWIREEPWTGERKQEKFQGNPHGLTTILPTS